ncbi:SRPK2 bound unphosphorylated [Colletotrichum orchidophilum]|uniref:non-specific serine/threonine protein kinase n=1 Tax=Colletotrichum orchidophilum TaxID=1209926 RepID=A0A1G4BQF6_9PEZI|nr:SRPK2 bound unphosphorylated [Colletotrichum orchidophilum]OHF03682.1 SRPK2 bound unphosphorylated [Colletotrichum orchidophilum]
MAAPITEYSYIEDVERLSDYRPGGYHPIQINDRLHKRYRIVHKFGHGTFSTAWLALDERTSNYVAIKVGTADADRREVDILSQLTKGVAACSSAADKASMIPVAVDRFSLDGPNGTHPCFVTVPARCSLVDAKEASDSRLFQLEVARSLAAQLAMAVSLVHSQGYAHGDLHLGNVLLQLPSSLNNLSVERLYANFGAPEQEPVVRLDGRPTSSAAGVPLYAVPPVWLGIASDEVTLNGAKVLLSDFGVAFRPSDKSRFESHTPLVIRPPEAFFEPTTPLSFASDIWSLGCIIFELLAHRSLIDGILAPLDEITAQQIHLQGPPPSEWWDNWDQRFKWFDETGRPLSNQCDIWSWDRRFEQWVQEPRRSCVDAHMENYGAAKRRGGIERGLDEELGFTSVRRNAEGLGMTFATSYPGMYR